MMDLAPSSQYLKPITSLINTSFEEYKHHSLLAKCLADYLVHLKKHKEDGTLPKCLLIKAQKISINEEEGNTMMATFVESIQKESNIKLLEGNILSYEKTSANHKASISQVNCAFKTFLTQAIDAVKAQPLDGACTIPILEWFDAALAIYGARTHTQMVEHTLKKSAKEVANVIRNEAKNASQEEVDQMPTDASISQLIQKNFQSLHQSLQKEIQKEIK